MLPNLNTNPDRPTEARGQRFYCRQCGSEVEIINPSSAPTASLELRCCGQPMDPSSGSGVNLNVVDSGA